MAASPIGMKVKGLPSFSSQDGKCEIRYEGRIFLGRTNHLSIKFLKVCILQYLAIFVACKNWTSESGHYSGGQPPTLIN